jgi:hypothetical protein
MTSLFLDNFHCLVLRLNGVLKKQVIAKEFTIVLMVIETNKKFNLLLLLIVHTDMGIDIFVYKTEHAESAISVGVCALRTLTVNAVMVPYLI